MSFTCNSCNRDFTTRRGFNIHRASCKLITQEDSTSDNYDLDEIDTITLTPTVQQIETSLIVQTDEILLELEKSGETYQPDLPPYKKINVIPNSTIYNINGGTIRKRYLYYL